MQYTALLDQITAFPSLAIGVRVKPERQSRCWTLDQLAVAAEVSRRMWSSCAIGL
jgi:hypothetical protein